MIRTSKIIKITKKTNVERKSVYDIGVPDLNNFVLSNGHVVHNCDTGQQLSAKNFNYCVISVDRVDSDRICKPYQYLRSTIYEERIEMYNNDLLTDELIGLERDNNSGKLDHSPSGINSKDQADAVCGALWNASQHAEQFAFDYGETLETVTTINNSSNNYSQEQILIDLENEMKQAFSRPVKKDDDSNFINFGLGKAKPLTTQYLANGIALW